MEGDMKRLHLSKWVLVSLLVISCITGLGNAPGYAIDRPTIQDLTGGNVRPEQVIARGNVDAVKELIPDIFVAMVSRGMELLIAEPGPWHTPEYFIDITKTNQGQAYLDEKGNLRTQGGLFSNGPDGWWDGGIPFPDPQLADPQAGLKVMYNALYAYEGDDFVNEEVKILYVGSDGRLEKTTKIGWGRLYLTSRERLDPKPTFGEKFKNVFSKQLVYVNEPFDLRGFGILTIKYCDQTKQEDNYAYIPAMRRVRRLSGENKFDALVGSDTSTGDIRNLDVPLSRWKFKLIAIKPMLAMMHSKVWSKTAGETTASPDFTEGLKFIRTSWEIVPEVFVVEASPKDKRDCPIYSKKILYFAGVIGNSTLLEPLQRTFRTCYSVGYDVAGNMLRTTSNIWWGYGDPENPEGRDDIFFETCYYAYDLQLDHASPYVVDLPGRKFNVGFTPDRFSIGYLQRVGR